MKRTRLLTLSFFVFFSCLQLLLNAQDAAVRHVPDSVVNSFKTAKGYEYANDPAYWKKAKPPADSWNIVEKLMNPVLWKVIGYVFLAAMFIFVVYRLIANGVFYRKEKKPEQLNDLPDDIMKLDEVSLKSLLKDFLRDGKFREAIRAQYLLTLLALERSGLIKFDPNATNHDYADQLKEHKAHGKFSFLTRIYEYAWYGDIAVSEQDYRFAEKRFIDFKQQF